MFEHFCVIKAEKLYLCCYWHSNELREEYDFILNGFSVKKLAFQDLKTYNLKKYLKIPYFELK